MDTKKLRQKILDLAIRGKLVPQDPNDEPASVLLERIRAEKERLIKEGKIKRSKKTATNDEFEAPFEIPESWEWTRLGNFISIKSGDSIKVRENKNGMYPIYGGNGINGFFNDYNVPQNTLIIGRVGFNCGSVHLTSNKSWVTDNAFIVSFENVYVVKFLYYLLLWLDLGKVSNSTAQPVISGKGVYPLIVPIPPIAEQHSIAAAIERWLDLIYTLETNEGDLLKAIDQAKSKILDLAIHGKLVPQDPNDEPAIDLLKRINPKFETCAEENCPFVIPQSWEWTTLGKVSNYGNTINVEIKNIPQDAWVLELEDLEKDSATILKRVTKGKREIKGVRHSFKKGDVLYSKLRTYLNKVLVAPEEGYCTTEIIPISFQSGIQSTYINHVLRSRYFLDYTIRCGYGVKMPRLSTTDACKGLIPLPPFQEQLRIVSKIEELFTILDSIKESLA